MKKLTKMAIAIGIASASLSVVAAEVDFEFNGDIQASYSYNEMTVQPNGTITVNLLTSMETVPVEFCGTNTDWDSAEGKCVGAGGGQASCGVGTSEEDGVCVGDKEYWAAPTLIIGGATSMGDGDSTANITFTFSSKVTDFTKSDISVSPSAHTIASLTTTDNITFKASLVRSGNNSGSITVSVANNSYKGVNTVNGTGATHAITLTGAAPTVGNCDVPGHVSLSNISALTSFGSNSSMVEFRLPAAPNVLSYAVTTTSGSANGIIKTAGDSGTSLDKREVWFSDCPGGEPLSKRCSYEGSLGNVNWKQGPGGSPIYCALKNNKTYFLNMSSSTCKRSGGCTARVQHMGGW